MFTWKSYKITTFLTTIQSVKFILQTNFLRNAFNLLIYEYPLKATVSNLFPISQEDM